MASQRKSLAAVAPRFVTLPPDEVAYRDAQMRALVAEAFARKAAAKPAPTATCCAVCTFPITARERIARMPGGAICHAGCRAADTRPGACCAKCGGSIDVRLDVVAIRGENLYHGGSCA